MRYSKLFFALSGLLILLSCSKSNYNDFIQTSLLEKFGTELKELKGVIILPNQGCSGCISEGEGFLKTYYAEFDSVKFILNRIVSKKMLKQKLGDSIYFNKSIYIDSLNFFVPPFHHDKLIYPTLIYLNNGKITDIEYQHPNSNSIGFFLDYLENK